jgi:hypothetical protein
MSYVEIGTGQNPDLASVLGFRKYDGCDVKLWSWKGTAKCGADVNNATWHLFCTNALILKETLGVLSWCA